VTNRPPLHDCSVPLDVGAGRSVAGVWRWNVTKLGVVCNAGNAVSTVTGDLPLFRLGALELTFAVLRNWRGVTALALAATFDLPFLC
jgi:hypothetical protein